MSVRMIKAHQVRLIHTLKSKLMIDDDTYRLTLKNRYNGIATSKDLSEDQATDFVRYLEGQAMAAGVWNRPPRQRSQRRNDGYGQRDADMASVKQLRMIEARWAEVSRIQDDEAARLKALDQMCHRICGVRALRWLRKADVQKMLKAIQVMK